MTDELTPPPPPVSEPEPDGVIDVQGKKMVPVDALVAERERARTTTEQRLHKEYEGIKAKAAKADQLEADMQLLQPQIEHLRKHPELLQEPARPDVPDVSDEDAEKHARRYGLYTPTGLDLPLAKQMIADHRADTRRIATEAAHEAIQPYARTTATAQSRQNFAWAASQKTPDGRPVVDATQLATLWATFPPELTANPEVAKVVLRAALGESVLSNTRPAAPDHEPLFTERPGGGKAGDYQISPLERRVAQIAGMTEKQYSDRAKTYQPDAVNVLGD